MPAEHVNYDQIAPTYHQRYSFNRLDGIAAALRSLAHDSRAERILEVGCGTGRWLGELRPVARHVFGLDLSPGMLQQARRRDARLAVTCGQAIRLPFPAAAFDLVFCVNAFHHFPEPRAFIAEARRLLRPGGALAILGMEPRDSREWYLYDYFEGTYATDLRRFSSTGTIMDWMTAAGFDRVEWRLAEGILHSLAGREVLADHFLQKHSTSQLALLTDEAYAAGLARIEAALAAAEAEDNLVIFPVDISMTMVTGQVK